MDKKNNKETVIHFGLFGGLIFAIFFVAMFCLIATGFFVFLAVLAVGTILVWVYDQIHTWLFPRRYKGFTHKSNRY